MGIELRTCLPDTVTDFRVCQGFGGYEGILPAEGTTVNPKGLSSGHDDFDAMVAHLPCDVRRQRTVGDQDVDVVDAGKRGERSHADL